MDSIYLYYYIKKNNNLNIIILLKNSYKIWEQLHIPLRDKHTRKSYIVIEFHRL